MLTNILMTRLFLAASLLVAVNPSHAYKKMETIPVDIQYYKSEVEFSDVSFVVPTDASELERRVKEYFLEQNWSLNASSFFPKKRLKISSESFNLIADIVEARRPAIDAADYRKDEKIRKKWMRSQRWKDWSEEPMFRWLESETVSSQCVTYESNVIKAEWNEYTNSFKDVIEVCMGDNNSETLVSIMPSTSHFIDGSYQAASGQVGWAWWPWLDGTRLALEVRSLNRVIRGAPINTDAEAPKVPPQSRQVSSGTAFYVAGKVLITNHHVIDGCGEVNVDGAGTVTVAASDEANDLAILVTENSGPASLRLSPSAVSLGENVSVIGYPLQSVLSPTPHLTKGNISALAGLGGNTTYFQMTAPIQPGNSGGPVLNENNEVIGVATSTLSPQFALKELGTLPQGVNFAVRATLVDSLLDIYGFSESATMSSTQSEDGLVATAVKLVTCLVN